MPPSKVVTHQEVMLQETLLPARLPGGKQQLSPYLILEAEVEGDGQVSGEGPGLLLELLSMGRLVRSGGVVSSLTPQQPAAATPRRQSWLSELGGVSSTHTHSCRGC